MKDFKVKLSTWAHQQATRFRPYEKRIVRIWQAISMRSKLTVLFAGLILVMTAFFYGFALYQTTREIKVSAIYKAQAIAEALKTDVIYTLQTRNFSNLGGTFRRLSAVRSDIAYVTLIDPGGQVMVHSRPDEVGRTLTDRLSQQQLESEAVTVRFHRINLENQGLYDDLCDVSIPIVIRGRRQATLRIGISLTQYLLSNGPRIRFQLALFALPFACLSILIAMKLAESFTRPLQRLAGAASEVSHGNYDVQVLLNRQDELGEVAQAFNIMAAHLKENFAKVSDMANRDGLTGLYNARFFQEALSREIDRTKRTGRPLSLLIFDADRFKRINDHYGHPLGDQILQHVSRIARAVLRGYDVLARYGGEEFIAMLTETSGPQALLLGERLRKIVEQRPYVTEEGDVIKATISVGVAQAHLPYDKREIISQVDQALYQAKDTGRNRVILFKPENVISLQQ